MTATPPVDLPDAVNAGADTADVAEKVASASRGSGYDAFLLLGFGGPEHPDEVMPFLRTVTRGRDIPDERLAEVAEHYYHFDGVSPINAQNRALLAALRTAFAEHDIHLPLYWGNRNSAPWLGDVVADMAADGVQSALVLATSAAGGYSGCRQYRQNLADARAGVPEAPLLTKLRHFFNHPGFVEANVDRVRTALAELPTDQRDTARLVFTAHSVPESANAVAGPEGDLYRRQQLETARLVAEAVRGSGAEFDLVWQSRSGPPRVPWLGPDINDHLRALAADGVHSVLIAPTGFVSDHLEVLWDLDNEAAATAAELDITMVRAGTAGTHPAFVQTICDLVQERLAGAPKLAVGPMGPSWNECPVDDGCCLPRKA